MGRTTDGADLTVAATFGTASFARTVPASLWTITLSPVFDGVVGALAHAVSESANPVHNAAPNLVMEILRFARLQRRHEAPGYKTPKPRAPGFGILFVRVYE